MVPILDLTQQKEQEHDSSSSLAVSMCYADSPSVAGGATGAAAAAAKKFEGEQDLLRQRSRVESVSSVSVAKEGRGAAELCVKDGASSNKGSETSPATTQKHNEPFENHPIAYSIPFFILVAYGTKEFSIVFPYVMAPWAATQTYVHAGYHYDDDRTHFDNSVWTWGTDYALAGLMLVLAVRCLLARSGKSAAVDRVSRTLRVRSAVLLAMYAISTLAGGYAHQTYTTIESMNSISFRIWWTICVGSVCAAGGVMGSIGTEVCRHFHSDARRKLGEVPLEIPVVPDGFWLCWGVYITAVCVRGDISYHRPACDIFIAGTTQFVPTAYCVSLLLVRKWREDGASVAPTRPAAYVLRPFRVMYYLGFVDNSVLLPSYPLLVQYTDFSLGTINTLLHAWLTLSWGMQAIGLRHLCLAVDRAASEAEAEA